MEPLKEWSDAHREELYDKEVPVGRDDICKLYLIGGVCLETKLQLKQNEEG